MERLQKLVWLSLFIGFAWANEATELSKVVDDFWSWRLMDNPEFATQVGEHNYDDRLMSFEYEQFEERKTRGDEFLKQLNAIDSSKLGKEDKTTYSILKDSLETYVNGYKWRNHGALNPINFLEGVHIDFPGIVTSAPFNTTSDYEKFISRLRKVPAQVSQQIALMKMAIANGVTNHNVSMIAVKSQINLYYNMSVESLDLYVPFKERLSNNSNIQDSDKAQLRSEAQTVLSTIVVPTFQNLSRFIEDEYIPNCRTSYGVSSLPNGINFYKACLKWHLSVDLTPEQVHNKGLEEVKRLKGKMLEIMKKTAYNGSTLVDYFQFLKQDARFYRNTSEEILQIYNDIIFKRIKPQLPKLFNGVPDYRVVVKPMKLDGPGGMYSFPSEDGSTPGIFWVNLRNPEKRATFDMPSLTLHEADPGHHMQISYMLRESNPQFRKQTDYSKYYLNPFHFPFFTAYTEGWALYAEDLGLEMDGSYADDYELFGKYSSEMFRACRLVVDTGMHALGWSRDRAIDYMVEHTFDLKSQLVIEVDRYITWPGQACAYKIGQLKIQELRKKAETDLGDSFKIAEFHDVVLRLGAAPLGILEDEVNGWIQGKMTSNAASNVPLAWFLLLIISVTGLGI